jgi:uncharacterized membrane protein YbhN (UPF0104 family)
MKKGRMELAKRLLQIGFSLLVLYLLGRFIAANWKEFETVFEIGWNNFFGLILCLLGLVICSSTRFAHIYRALGARIGYIESFGLYMASGIFNLLLPAQSGSAVRAVYLKERYQIPYSQAPAAILGGLVITFSVGGLIMLLTNLAYIAGGQPPPNILWLVSLIFTASLFFLWMRVPKWLTARLGRVGKMLDLFFAGIQLLRAARKEFFLASLWQLGEFLSAGLAFWVAFNSLDVSNFTFFAGIHFAVIAALLNTVFITPGNIGILEVAIGYVSQIYRFTFIQGLSATALVHGGGYLIYYIIAPISWYFIFHRRKA